MGRDLAIGPYRLDDEADTLHGDSGPIPLGTRGVALLRALAKARGGIVSKSALMDAAWPGVAVEESNLTVQIAALRRILGDGLIATVARRGYRLSASGERGEYPNIAPDNEPSLAVLSLLVDKHNAEERYFSDGVARAIIDALSRFAGLRLIAASSSLAFGGAEVDVETLGRELRVRYALIVGVQRAERRVRVSAQLIETGTRMHKWAEHYDRDLEDIFGVQDEVAEQIAGLLMAHVVRAEQERSKRKPPHSLQAYDYYLRALDHSRMWHRTDCEAAEQMLERALALVPDFAAAQALLSRYLVSGWLEPKGAGWGQHATLERALRAAQSAVEGDPYLPAAHASLGWVQCWHDELDASIASFERAQTLNPGFVDGRYGHVLSIAGYPEAGMKLLARARSLDPFHAPMLLGYIGHSHLLVGQPGAALHPLRECTTRAPGWRPAQVWLAATCAALGLVAEAREAAARVMALDPGFAVETWQSRPRHRDVACAEKIATHLLRAGFPARAGLH